MATLAQRRAEAHRQAQARLAAALAAIVARSYAGVVTPDGVRGLTYPTFQEAFTLAILPHVLRSRQRSESLAARYLASEQVDPLGGDPLVEEALFGSISATGFAGLVQRLIKGQAPQDAISHAQTAAVGAATRHALAGGRSNLARSLQVRTDVGYYRVARAGCCSFCALLMSRGAVYGPDSFDESDPRFLGNGEIKVHDHCHCEWGIIRRGDEEPDSVQLARQLWDDSARRAKVGDVPDGLSKLPQDVFRRAWEALDRGAT